jgi:RHS repeat-associated protein
MVEVDNGSTKTEILYTQLGKTAYMNGSSFSYAYWPAPGGGTLLQDAGYSYYYQHKDWLGNVRLSSSANESHNVIIGDYAYAPYGEKYNIFGSTAQNQTMFTGDTQDVLAGMYDTPNRELQGSQQGRWLSPDPAGFGWNQYAYSTNPNSQVDPSGLDDDDDDGGDGSGGVGLGSSSGVAQVYAPDVDSVGSGVVSVQADLTFSGTPMGLNTNGDYSDGASMLAALNPMSFNPATGEDTSDIDISSDMVNNANALAPALGHGNDFMQGAVAAVGFQAGIAGAIFAGPAVASAAVNRLLFGPALNRVFWYGAGYFAASSYAATSEGTMLGDTPVGSVLDFFTRPIAGGFGFGWETMQPYWASASQMFAQGAQGPVLMFPGIVANPASIWFTEELPALTDNGTQIITMGP